MPNLLIFGAADFVPVAGQMLLEAKGYRLTICANLHDAIAMILENPPDFLLLEKSLVGDDDLKLIQAVASLQQMANIVVLLALDAQDLELGLNLDDYPVDDLIFKPLLPKVLLAHLRLAEARMHRVFDNNPLTRLPGNTSILRAINQALSARERRAVCYVDIDNFKPYNDRYGFSRGDEVILMVARIIVNVVKEKVRNSSFVGHVGGDDFVFIAGPEVVEDLCQKIIANFNLVRNLFLSAEDIAAGEFVGKDRLDNETRFPLLSISIAAVIIGDDRYRHSGEVVVAATQLKHYVKKLEGSNYLIERRSKNVNGQMGGS